MRKKLKRTYVVVYLQEELAEQKRHNIQYMEVAGAVRK